jgi:deaminated glutathione amidase
VRAAAVQMTSTTDVARNLDEAARLLEAAAGGGAELVVLPENFSFLGSTDADRLGAAEAPTQGPAQQFLAAQSRALGIWIVGGTIPIADGRGRAYSRSLLWDPTGRCAAQYDKIHLFDVDIPDSASESYRESNTTQPGADVTVAATPLGRIGMVVCYDLRFPALFHRLSVLGTDILVVPAAFTVPTGRAHWETLLRARAIESLSYVVASGQWGQHAGERRTYGHSMIVGPWGEILDTLPAGTGVASAELDIMGLTQLRAQFPVLEHRREL